MASSKFFAAMALLPRALSSSAVDMLGVQLSFWGDLECRRYRTGLCSRWGYLVNIFLPAGERGTRSQGWSLNSFGNVVAAQPMESFDAFRWPSDVLIGAS